jgi:cell division protein FtsI/penicillin-binding protein 2
VLRDFEGQIIRHVNVTQESLREVKAGMDQVTSPIGTGYGLAIPAFRSAARAARPKPGVGGSGKNTTWFVMYAPAPHPQIAMAVYMEKSGGYGASVAGIVAQHIVADYFGKKIPRSAVNGRFCPNVERIAPSPRRSRHDYDILRRRFPVGKRGGL